MSHRTNRRGQPLVNNKTEPTRDDFKLGNDDREHQFMLRYFEPNFEETLREVCLEVAEMRIEKRLRPFVEGEPIGAYKKPPKPKRVTDAQVREYKRKRYEWGQEELRALRAKNDAELKRLA